MTPARHVAGLRNIQYGIVGFGGVGAFGAPHIHTMDGKIMNSRNKVLHGLHGWIVESGADIDPLLAVNYAANYAFRTGASKTVILMPCTACRETAVTYADTHRLLRARDIRLHVVGQHHIYLRTKSAKAAHIFGESMTMIIFCIISTSLEV